MRTDLISYRNHLLDSVKAQVTALNKLMSVTTWLNKNTVVSITGLLKAEDWPKKPDTEPRPYIDAEQEAMMGVATYEERLLLRFFLGTGMRSRKSRTRNSPTSRIPTFRFRPSRNVAGVPRPTPGRGRFLSVIRYWPTSRII